MKRDGQALTGVIPGALVPVYKLKARFVRSGKPPQPAMQRPAQRPPKPLWTQSLRSAVYGGLAFDPGNNRVIAASDIDWIRADGNYVHIHAGSATYLHRESLRHLLAVLDPTCFLRIHRGIVVNVERIREVHPLFQGSAEVVLQDGTRLSLSRRFRLHARRALGMA